MFLFKLEKHQIVPIGIFSFVFSLSCTIGKAVYTDNSIISIYSSLSAFVLFVVKTLFFLAITVVCLCIIFHFLTLIDKKHFSSFKILRFLSSSKGLFIIWASIFILWLPYFLAYYPGMYNYDISMQEAQILAKDITTFHPPIHTFIWKLCLYAKDCINVNPVSVYCICQMIFISFCSAFMISYMCKRNVRLILVIFSFAFVALNPVAAVISMCATKDSYFAGLFILYLIYLCAFLSDSNAFISKSWNLIILSTISLLLCLFRNNCIYAFVASALIGLFHFRKQINLGKQFILFILPIVLFMLITRCIYPVCGVRQESMKESLSVPLVQISCVVSRHCDELTDDEVKMIENFMSLDCEGIKEMHNPRLADGMKNFFLENNIFSFFPTWLHFLGKYPADYIDAFLSLNCPYWYPFSSVQDPYSNKLFIETNVTHQLCLMKPMYENSSKFPALLSFTESVCDLSLFDNIPILKNLFSISLPFWSMLFCLCFLIYRYKMKFAYLFCLPLFYWLTFLLGPVSIFRYFFCFYLSYPFLITIIFDSNNLMLNSAR